MDLPDFLIRDADGFVRISGHRIGVEHIAFHYREGYSPEMLIEQYPTLSLPLIHKVIAFYLEHREAVDEMIDQTHVTIERQRAASPPVPTLADLRKRLAAKQQASAPTSQSATGAA